MCSWNKQRVLGGVGYKTWNQSINFYVRQPFDTDSLKVVTSIEAVS